MIKAAAIGSKKLALPIIQGGMGVGISLGNLAGHVARCGGMGVISTVNAGYRDPDFWKTPLRANTTALAEEIAKARKIAGQNGMLAINIMVATTHYAEMVKTAINAGIDAIVSGAGLPMELPALAKESGVALAPIVSSGKGARVVCTMWQRKHDCTPDFIVVEGSKAGGHLGFSAQSLQEGTAPALQDILADVLKEVAVFEEKAQMCIPVFVAGGVQNGADIAMFTQKGAAGVQMATRFIATDECDASLGYKQAIVNATSEDVCIISSPVGMPGRALNSPLVQKLRTETIPVSACIKCLHPCDRNTTPYCISNALIQAAQGNWEDGLFFCGDGVGTVNSIVPVQQLMQELAAEWEAAL